MNCSICGNKIKKNDVFCEKCGHKIAYKDIYIGNFILIVGSIFYGIIISLCITEYINLSLFFPVALYTIFNLVFCIYIYVKHLDSSLNYFINNSLPYSLLIPMFICLVFMIIFPGPECEAECLNRLGYGFSFMIPPFFSIICYTPILIEKIIIAFKKQKYTIHIFIIIIFLLLILDRIMSIGTPIKTNNLEDTLDFDVVSIRYDSEKKIPILSDERIKYYAKYEIGDGVVYYFLLKPGMYSIEGVSYGWFDKLYKNRFNKTGGLFSRTTDKNILINETRNDNYIYRYSINRQGDYLLSGERIDIYQEYSKREKRRYELNQDYLLLVFKSGLEEGIEIEKLD